MMKYEDFDLSKNADALLPVIIQDAHTLKVLMLGYMDKQAFDTTVGTGKVTFYSRSRRQQWTKGETSGNYLNVVEMLSDCDSDTLLIKAVPEGPTCHRGTTACFDTDEAEGFIRKLQSVVQDRHRNMPADHYTTYLFGKGVNKIAQKVGEEAVETVIEAVSGNVDRYRYEASDLLYHLLVLNEQMGITLSDLEKELLSRHR